MLTLTIQKNQLDRVMLPYLYDGALIVSKKIGVMERALGYKNGILNAYDQNAMPDEIEINIPDSETEFQAVLEVCQVAVQRILMAPDILVEGLEGEPSIPFNQEPELVIEPFKTITRVHIKRTSELL